MEFCHLGSDLKTKKDSQRRVQSVNKKNPQRLSRMFYFTLNITSECSMCQKYNPVKVDSVQRPEEVKNANCVFYPRSGVDADVYLAELSPIKVRINTKG